MKYSKKTLSVLISDVRALVDQAIRFELTQKEIITNFADFLQNHFKTENGKKRYPDYYQTSLTSFFNEFLDVRKDENTIWCYSVDGVLYHGMKKANCYYNEKETKIPNYRDNPEIEAKILDPNNNIQRGFFYNSGKPYWFN